METPSSWPWRALKAVGTWLVALLILFEEWGWVPLARLLGLVARWPAVRWLERRIVALPPRVALAVLFVPMLLLLPFKVGALWLIAGGRAVFGVLLLLVAKMAGTGVVARLFMLTRPQLMHMPWFSRAYGRWIVWKGVVLARVRASPPWRAARGLKRRLRTAWRG